jgi:aspartokinase
MRGMAGTAARVFGAVARSGVSVRMISQGARENNIAFLVKDDAVAPVVQALHAELFEGAE